MEGYSKVWRGRMPSVYQAYENLKEEETEPTGVPLFFLSFCFLLLLVHWGILKKMSKMTFF